MRGMVDRRAAKGTGRSGLAVTAAGAVEAGGAEIGEERGDSAGQEEMKVVGGVGGRGPPSGAEAPGTEVGGGGEEAEEDAGELEPENAGKAAERGSEGLGEAAGAGPGLVWLGWAGLGWGGLA